MTSVVNQCMGCLAEDCTVLRTLTCDSCTACSTALKVKHDNWQSNTDKNLDWSVCLSIATAHERSMPGPQWRIGLLTIGPVQFCGRRFSLVRCEMIRGSAAEAGHLDQGDGAGGCVRPWRGMGCAAGYQRCGDCRCCTAPAASATGPDCERPTTNIISRLEPGHFIVILLIAHVPQRSYTLLYARLHACIPAHTCPRMQASVADIVTRPGSISYNANVSPTLMCLWRRGNPLVTTADFTAKPPISLILFILVRQSTHAILVLSGAAVVGQGADGFDHTIPLRIYPPQVAAHLVAARAQNVM